MLVSTHVDHRAFFSGLHAVVVDEVHAFAGDDRGWHLLAVLLTPARWKAAVTEATLRLCLPEVDGRAVRGLKFAEALPARLAEATLAARTADEDGARAVLTEPVRLTTLNRP